MTWLHLPKQALVFATALFRCSDYNPMISASGCTRNASLAKKHACIANNCSLKKGRPAANGKPCFCIKNFAQIPVQGFAQTRAPVPVGNALHVFTAQKSAQFARQKAKGSSDTILIATQTTITKKISWWYARNVTKKNTTWMALGDGVSDKMHAAWYAMLRFIQSIGGRQRRAVLLVSQSWVDKMQPNADRLRALGNAVVPAVAQKAFAELFARHASSAKH